MSLLRHHQTTSPFTPKKHLPVTLKKWKIFTLPQRTDQLHHSNTHYPNLKKRKALHIHFRILSKKKPYPKKGESSLTNFSSTKKTYRRTAHLFELRLKLLHFSLLAEKWMDPTTPNWPSCLWWEDLCHRKFPGETYIFKIPNKNNIFNKNQKDHQSYCWWGTTTATPDDTPMWSSMNILNDHHLVGGFNPSEKYESKWVHLPQFSGWK